MTNEADFKKYVDRIEKMGEIQEKIADMRMDASNEEIDQLFQSIPKEFFSSKTKFDNFLQAIISNLFGGSKRERTTLLILEKLKDQINLYFKNDEVHLIKIVEPYIFVNEWFFENGFLSIDTIISESQYDTKLSHYFLPEIIENKPSLFYERLITRSQKDYAKSNYLPVESTNDVSFTKNELNEIKNRRRNQIQVFLSQNRDYESYYSYDPSILRCSLMSDDIDRFQDILSRNNISINSDCPPSIYDPSFFPMKSYNNETRTLIEAAALFGSIKIFKFLLLNNACLRPKEIFRRVLFGRNFDIFHIVEKFILERAPLVKVKKKDYKSSKDPKTQSYVDLYMGNDDDLINDSEVDKEDEDKEGSKDDDDKEGNKEDNKNDDDKEGSKDDDDDKENNKEDENKEVDKENNKNDEDKECSKDDDDDEQYDDDEESSNEYDEDEYVWVLDKEDPASDEIKSFFSNCMMYAIKYGFDEISDYLYDNYETMFDFEINTSIVSEREVNFCMKNFKKKLLPIFMKYPNDGDEFGNTYLMNAAYFNYTDFVKILLRVPGIDVNFFNPRNKTTAMSRAADQYSFKTIKILLKSPLFNYTYDKHAAVYTPFVKATCHGYIELMKLFIETKRSNENDERFKDMLVEGELDEAFFMALVRNQGESLKVIMDNFPEFPSFEGVDNNNITFAAQKKCWESLWCLHDELKEKKEMYDEKFPDKNVQEIIELIETKLEDENSWQTND